MGAGIVASSTHDLLPGLNPLVPNLPLEVADKLAVAQESRTSGAKEVCVRTQKQIANENQARIRISCTGRHPHPRVRLSLRKAA